MEHFDTWPEAFDTCRERNRPLHVQVGGERWTIFPSGHAKPLNMAATEAGIAEGYLKMKNGRVVHT